ncbi:unnamed protein product [Dovyalis caffra]|uniref:Pentatricopeptide repeat-containing protein n=1 Tax=Dovyalis caffra TaxID=77055 RepID=A0AAV1QYW9_9ROSI|nr:unnamed protein product [Dovyalis caffra]
MSSTLLPKHVAAVLKHQKDPLKALEMFNKVKKEDGFKHTFLTYKCIIQQLGFHGKFEAMEDVLVEMRMNIDNSMLEGVYIGAMKSYGRKGKVQEAVDVFERMDFYNCEQTVLSYNTIMNILVEFGYFKQAHKVYLRMKYTGIVPDVYSFTIRIKSFCRTKRPHAALRLLNNMASQGCQLNAVAHCTVVAGFYEENYRFEAKGVLNGAKSLLDSVIREGLTPDVVSYNTLICGLCKNSDVVEAEKYLHKLVNDGLEPDGFTYNTIIDGYCKMGMIQNAEKILQGAIFKGFVPDEFTYCSLINGLCQNDEIDRALALFNVALTKGLKPTVILYNMLIKGLCQQGLILQALQMMNEMSENGYGPDIWTYNLVINGLCKMGCVSDANNLMNDAIAKGYIPDVFTFNTLIDGYCKQSKMETTIQILNKMWSHGVTPDVITYNSVLNGLCKAAKTEDLMEAFKMMVEKGCVPNKITYNILTESLCKGGKVNEALDLVDEIVNKGITPDTVSFATVISGFHNRGDLKGAYQLFRRMEEQYKVSHTTATYNVMISAFAEKLDLQMAEKLFLEMGAAGCAPDTYTYRVMIDGFCIMGNTDFGYNYLLEMIEKGFIPSLTTFGRVINCLCVQHRIHEAVDIIHLMVRNGIVPEVVNTISEADKKVVAAPKIVVEDLLKRSCITYYAYELFHLGLSTGWYRWKTVKGIGHDPNDGGAKGMRRGRGRSDSVAVSEVKTSLYKTTTIFSVLTTDWNYGLVAPQMHPILNSNHSMLTILRFCDRGKVRPGLMWVMVSAA